jgi:hypothetical protein
MKLKKLLLVLFLFVSVFNIQSQEEKKDRKKDTLRYNSFFIASVIKTLSGDKPDNELFDLTFNLNAGQSVKASRFNFFGSVDISLNNVETDSIGSTSKKIVDAGIAVNYDLFENYENKELRIYVGPDLKVFDTNAYYGFHIGGMLMGNDFYSSYFNLGYVRPLNKTDSALNLLTRFNDNILTEFAFTSRDAPILKNIRVKGGIIFPIGKTSTDNDITARIVIQIPLGGIYRFGGIEIQKE